MNRLAQVILGLAVAAIPAIAGAQTQPAQPAAQAYGQYVQQNYPQAAQSPAQPAPTQAAQPSGPQLTPQLQPAPEPQLQPAPPQPIPQGAALAPAQLDQLTGTIALYPDVLLGQVLTAAAHPADVVNANQFIHDYPLAGEFAFVRQPWDPSVRTIVHYPTVLALLANNPGWMQSLASAYAYQPTDVMNAVQRLRFSAYNAGALTSNADQQVLVDNGAIQILPASQAVYVPVYDPNVVFVSQGYVGSPIRYCAGVSFGGWNNCSIDWRARAIRPVGYAPRFYGPGPYYVRGNGYVGYRGGYGGPYGRH